MASTGFCPNTTGCTLGFRKEPIKLGADARCPECGTPLQPATTGPAEGDRWKLWLIVALAGLLAVICVLLVVVLFRRPSGSDVSTTPRSTAAPVVTPSDTGTKTPPSHPSPTQPPGPTATPTPPHAEPEVTKRTPERDAVRRQVLQRIERMPNITEQQRDVLYTQLEHAQGFGRMATIGFDAGQNELTTGEIQTFEKALQHPRIRKLLDNPSIILVVLGFADAVESPDSGLAASTDRAESVANVLRHQGGVLNVIHTVGMGNSDMFGAAPEQNRVTEVWAVLP